MRRLLIVSTVAATLRAFLLPFARHYRGMGWRVDAAAHDATELQALREEFDACYRLPLSRNPLDVRMALRAPARIRQLVIDGRYDIVHVHTPVAAFFVRYALRRLPERPRVVYTAHGFHFHRNGQSSRNLLFQTAEWTASRWCDALITINRDDFSQAHAAGFRTRIVWMPGIGVNTEQWSPSVVSPDQVAQVRRELRLGDDDVLFLMVAEFNPGKRHVDALEALRRTASPHIHLAFAGDGPTRALMERTARRYGLGARTHFLGFRRDIPALMRASRAVLLPSEREGLPRSLLEALSLGVPILGADTRGITELADGGCGIIHGVGRTDELAAALTYFATFAAAAAAMGQRGRERIVAEYGEQRVISLHDALYADLLQPSGLDKPADKKLGRIART